jgi:phenylpropionate dioxygenase-like ring-hydroxylating dioxygenase large terminal subunit
MDAATIDQESERRLARGLPGLWYVVAKSVQVRQGEILPVTILGRRLVLWRNAEGQVCCVEDFCPHRGAPLSRGEIIDGNLVCRYHGVTLDGTGTIVRVPGMADCPLEGRRTTLALQVREANDGVFVYMPVADEEPPPLDLPYEFSDPNWSGFLCAGLWHCNWRLVAENTADPMHGIYLHADSFTLAYGTRQDLVELKAAERGFIVTRVAQTDQNFDWCHVITDGSTNHIRLDIPYPPAGGPGGPFRVLGFLSPVDEHSTRIFFWRNRQVTGLEREAWRFLFRAFFEARHWEVLEQDREMLEGIPDGAERRELLYQHDAGVVRLRRILRARVREQVEAGLRAQAAE